MITPHNALHVLHTQSLYVHLTAGPSLIEGLLMEQIAHHLTKDNSTVFSAGTRQTHRQVQQWHHFAADGQLGNALLNNLH